MAAFVRKGDVCQGRFLKVLTGQTLMLVNMRKVERGGCLVEGVKISILVGKGEVGV